MVLSSDWPGIGFLAAITDFCHWWKEESAKIFFGNNISNSWQMATTTTTTIYPSLLFSSSLRHSNFKGGRKKGLGRGRRKSLELKRVKSANKGEAAVRCHCHRSCHCCCSLLIVMKNDRLTASVEMLNLASRQSFSRFQSLKIRRTVFKNYLKFSISGFWGSRFVKSSVRLLAFGCMSLFHSFADDDICFFSLSLNWRFLEVKARPNSLLFSSIKIHRPTFLKP